ncbi:unnamed protein product [Sphagnum jensenii]|uniref:Uncharacterized protein n=1 Tax=Sphagnum jensenii TaxID=128206 RepID=A0ABP1A5H2_9BRYO
MLSLAIDDNNKVIQVASHLKLGSYVLMTPGKIDRTLISMSSKFIMFSNVLIVKAHVMYMPVGYNNLADKYVSSNYG